jgi:DNA repair exonuclease SbcCD ATPase subunit
MSEQTDSIQKRVNDLCNDFLIKGVKITSRLILSEMPDIKSTSTIHKYFTAWKEATKQTQSALYDHLGFSPEFTQSFAKEITRFGVEAERRHETASLEAIEQRDEAIKGLERVESERDKQASIAIEQAAELVELRSEITSLMKKCKSDVDAEKRSCDATIKELRTQLQELSVENKKLVQSNETLRTSLAKEELKVETNKEYVDTVKAQVAAVTEQNTRLNEKVLELSSNRASLSAELEGSKKLINTLQSQDAQYTKQIDELREQSRELRTDLKTSNSQISNLSDKVQAQTNTIQSYEEIFKSSKGGTVKPTHDEQGKLIS